MRVLAASDIHGSHDVYRWLTSLVDSTRVDMLVLAGDLLGVPDGYETVESAQAADARSITDILEPLSVPVFYIMGSDDWVELVPTTQRLRSLNLTRTEVGRYNLVGYQYTLPFMGGVFERPEEVIGRDLQSLVQLIDGQTVLVTHGPALGILDSTLLGPAGSAALRDIIERQPIRAHIHGHIHACFGRHERHFNVAAGRKRRAMLIDLDTMVHDIVDGEAA
jgi:uncharacterized protein